MRNALIGLEGDAEEEWTGSLKNENCYIRLKEDRNLLIQYKERRLTGVSTSCVGTAF
jgi:hypothetical protein